MSVLNDFKNKFCLQIIQEITPYEKALRAFIIVVGQLFQSFGYKDDCIESHA